MRFKTICTFKENKSQWFLWCEGTCSLLTHTQTHWMEETRLWMVFSVLH